MTDHNVGVLVLGCTVLPDGTPSDWLTDRLEATFTLIEHLLSKSAAQSTSSRFVLHVVLSGGAVRQTVTEASVMRAWLLARLVTLGAEVRSLTSEECSIPEKSTRLLVPCPAGSVASDPVEVLLHEEDQARDTVDNIVFGIQVLQQRLALGGANLPDETRPHLDVLWLVSSDFHAHRGYMLLQRELARVTNTTRGLASSEGGDGGIGPLPRVYAVSELSDHAVSAVESFPGENARPRGTQLRCLGALTPSLQGPAFSERQARETMLTRQNLLQHRAMFLPPDVAS